jgi:raffinose/stachyose/melibiose transport system substrate-binding protein
MKRVLALLTALVILTAFLAACKPAESESPDPGNNNNNQGNNNQGNNNGGDDPGSDVKEITLVSNKIEIDGALKAYAAKYEEQTGVKVNIITYGGATPYAPNLASMFSGGEEPEIFVFEGLAGFDEAKAAGRLTDLSGEDWVKDTDVAYVSDGKVYGFPVAIEGYGLGYNKELLDKAGVDASTLTTVGAIKAAFEKIDGMKDELGIEAVISMTAAADSTWVTGLHGVNTYLTLGLPYADSDKYIDMMMNGEVDTERLTKWAEYYDLLFRHSINNTLLVGGYDSQVPDFAMGKTVFIHQGNWIEPMLDDLGVDFEMGYAPHAFLDEVTDGIFAAAPSYYLVNEKSKGVGAAKAFLNALAATPDGHEYMVVGAGMIPAFKSVTLQPAGTLSKSVQDWAGKGKIYNWKQNDMPSGFGMKALGPIFTELARGNVDIAKFVELVTTEVENIRTFEDD